MEKVYLILRDNRQTGPYTIGELLQQQLRPTDMLWIEGASTAWAYLSEMELKPSVEVAGSKEEKSRVITEPAQRPTTSATPLIPESNKPKRRSSPPDEIERKAEELRKQVLTAGPQYSRSIDPQVIFDEYHNQSRVLIPVEEEIDFIDHREEKKLPVVEIVSGVLVTAFVAACIIGGRSLFADGQAAPVTIVAAKEVSTDEHQAKRSIPAASTMVMMPTDTTLTAAESSSTPDTTAIVKKPKSRISKSAIARDESNAISNPESIQVEPLSTVTKKEEATESSQTIKPEVESVTKKTEEIEKKDPVQQAAKENSGAQQEDKKKGLFRKIFGKKKKDD